MRSSTQTSAAFPGVRVPVCDPRPSAAAPPVVASFSAARAESRGPAEARAGVHDRGAHLGPHVEVDRRRRRVGPEPDADAGREQLGSGAYPAAEERVRARAVDGRHVEGRHELDVGGIGEDDGDGDRVGAQDVPKLVEVHRLAGRLEQVRGDRQPTLAGHPDQHPVVVERHRERGVRRHAGTHDVGRCERVDPRLGAGAQVGPVAEALDVDDGAQTGLGGGVGDRSG